MLKEEIVSSENSTTLSEITSKKSEKTLPRKPIAPLSKMGGQVIASQAGEIADMFLDDFLCEMISEL